MSEVVAWRDRFARVRQTPIGGDDGWEGCEKIAGGVVIRSWLTQADYPRSHPQRIHAVDFFASGGAQQLIRNRGQFAPTGHVCSKCSQLLRIRQLAVPEQV